MSNGVVPTPRPTAPSPRRGPGGEGPEEGGAGQAGDHPGAADAGADAPGAMPNPNPDPPPRDAGDLWRPARRDEAGRSEIRSAVYCGVGHFAAGQQEGDVWFEWPKSIPKGGWLSGWGLGGWWRLLDVRH